MAKQPQSEYARLVEAGEVKSRQKRIGVRKYDAEVAHERHREKTRRYMEAKRRMASVLAYRHKQEAAELFESELAAIYVERGALPGDEGSEGT